MGNCQEFKEVQSITHPPLFLNYFQHHLGGSEMVKTFEEGFVCVETKSGPW